MSNDAKPHVQIFDDPQKAAEKCAAQTLELLAHKLQQKGKATMAISGGSTPILMFKVLANSHFDWSNVNIFWVDERCVPPTDDQSNFKHADAAWLTPSRISKYNIHRIHGEMVPDEGALRYIEELKNHFELKEGELPIFDLIHRGMGPDAHTASLFPGDPLIKNRTGIAAAVWVEKMKNHRVTLLPGVLELAEKTFLLAAGPDKAEPLHNVLEGPDDPLQFPCQIAARNTDRATWFLDKPAAAKLSKQS